MSPYELSASVTKPIVGPHVDGTVFRTLCVNDNNRLAFFNEYHLCKSIVCGKMQEGYRASAHPLRYKKSIVPFGNNALM